MSTPETNFVIFGTKYKKTDIKHEPVALWISLAVRLASVVRAAQSFKNHGTLNSKGFLNDFA